MGGAAVPAHPAALSAVGLHAADVRGGLLCPVQQLRPLTLPNAQLQERTTAGLGRANVSVSPAQIMLKFPLMSEVLSIFPLRLYLLCFLEN